MRNPIHPCEEFNSTADRQKLYKKLYRWNYSLASKHTLSSASLPFFCCSFTTIWPQNQWWQLTKTWTTGKTQKLQITLEEFGLTFLSWGVTFLWWAESVWHLINVTIRVWTCCQSVSKEECVIRNDSCRISLTDLSFKTVKRLENRT